MDYDAVLAQVVTLLQQERRVAYRILKRRLQLDDETLGACPRIRLGQNLTSQNAPESTIGDLGGVLLPPKIPIFAFLGQAPSLP